MYRLSVFFLIFGILVGCAKGDPTPETSDVIYKDLLIELDIATKGLEAEEKNLAKLIKEKEGVVPQTGQIKFAMKRIYETEAVVDKLKQQKTFFEISIEQRKYEVRKRYLEARKGGRPWPDPKEIEDYKSTLKLQREKFNWDKNKGMKKDDVPRGTKDQAKPAGGEHH